MPFRWPWQDEPVTTTNPEEPQMTDPAEWRTPDRPHFDTQPGTVPGNEEDDDEREQLPPVRSDHPRPAGAPLSPQWQPGPDDTMGDMRKVADANAAHDDAEDDAEHCPTCGHELPTVQHLLNDTVNQISTRGGELLADFYSLMFRRRPDLAELFPADLVDAASDPAGAGKAQRDKLLNATVAVATHFNPRSKASMKALNEALEKMGATHGESRMTVEDPAWPGGRRPLLQIEYWVVCDALIMTLAKYQGATWTPQHHAAWWTALTYVSDWMGAAQILNLPRHGRRD